LLGNQERIRGTKEDKRNQRKVRTKECTTVAIGLKKGHMKINMVSHRDIINKLKNPFAYLHLKMLTR
jgi:hypothetical protein